MLASAGAAPTSGTASATGAASTGGAAAAGAGASAGVSATTTGSEATAGAGAASAAGASAGAVASTGEASTTGASAAAGAASAGAGAVSTEVASAGATSGGADSAGPAATAGTSTETEGASTVSTAGASAAAGGASGRRRPRRRTVLPRAAVEDSAGVSRRVRVEDPCREGPPVGTDGGPLGVADDERRRITRRPTRVSTSPRPPVAAGGDVGLGVFEAVRAGRRGRAPPLMTRSKRSFFDIQTSSARGWTAGDMC
jgi:hypothetical protein